ncbi:MAG: hypothetical protein M1829_003930 [Trizodia sp. TS-e1964]|nr:MAG: hypothetical protein M1829_003930 [Trizodia sp. TS-e1964]
MPQKDFLLDLEAAATLKKYKEVSYIRAGNDYGTFQFNFVLTAPYNIEVAIEAIVPELSDYPKDHVYFLFTSSDNVPLNITAALQELSDQSAGMRVDRLIESICSKLPSVCMPVPSDKGSDKSWPMMVDKLDALRITDKEYSDSDDQDQKDYNAAFWDTLEAEYGEIRSKESLPVALSRSNSDLSILSGSGTRIRYDLQIAKNAGFKVAFINHPSQKGLSKFLSISCRIRKLALSDEALEAWKLNSEHYLVLLIHYTKKYIGAEELAHRTMGNELRPVEFRVGTCFKYKPSLAEARGAFTAASSNSTNQPTSATSENPLQGFSEVFISTSLNVLMNDRFATLLKYRMEYNIPWSGAEAFYHDYHFNGARFHDEILDEEYSKSDNPMRHIPGIVMADHLNEEIDALSMPLIAIQLVLRHFVRCTEFCLVCYQRLHADFEALKPYVCDNPLCLYQYMALGLGPSIEHEIKAHPNVVDLLISFCYSSALCNKLRDFPNGMGLIVPPANPTRAFYPSNSHISSAQDLKSRFHNAFYFEFRNELLFTPDSERILNVGEWITIYSTSTKSFLLHCKVRDTSNYPVVQLSPPISMTRKPDPPTTTGLCFPPMFVQNSEIDETVNFPVEFVIYNTNFDDLEFQDKHKTICLMLGLLPSVKEMRTYVLQPENSCGASLKNWREKFPPAALGILRWIIASNRSYIVQVDDLESPIEVREASKHRITGMDGWLQFRFVQGAPDQEQRFIRSRNNVAQRLRLKYPSIFAWHGSPPYNWHGIIREGLDFRESHHGRSYGNGCYHSLNLQTSLSYSGIWQRSQPNWSQSALKIYSVVCLNEIVNAPSEFVSADPHLVVAQLDWIQTRFLFVKCRSEPLILENNGIQVAHPQDPSMTPVGAGHMKIVIPSCAMAGYQTNYAFGRNLTQTKETRKIVDLSDDNHSDEMDTEDLEFLDQDDHSSMDLCPNSNDRKNNEGRTNEEEDEMQTEEEDEMQIEEEGEMPIEEDGMHMEWESTTKATFKSDIKDQSTLPLLGPPTYATTIATSALQRELMTILKIQQKQPANEIGWYINPEFVSNVYQWIIELHSFDPQLPLSEDMAKKDINSIVIEMRFGGDYPMSPPFVRVISPRFLPFMYGGGGHVTSGGALCMELLTNSGWSAACSLESVLLQVRLAISSTEPRPARLEQGQLGSYGTGEAVEAFIRACRTHGWEVPRGINNFNSW